MNVSPMRSESTHEAGGTVAGVASAIVSRNDDPDNLGRVKLKLPWRSENNFETEWCRIAVPMAGKDRGTLFLPEVGDEVLVAFDRDDIRYPYVLGQLWSSADKPPAHDASSKKNDLRIIRTRKGHMITFDDNASKGRLCIELNDGKRIEIDDDGIVIDDTVNTLTMKSAGGSITLEASQAITLKAPTIDIQATTKLTANCSGPTTIKGAMVEIN
jgi:uncharacterized protein involved in type VI secretion and phage assembly